MVALASAWGALPILLEDDSRPAAIMAFALALTGFQSLWARWAARTYDRDRLRSWYRRGVRWSEWTARGCVVGAVLLAILYAAFLGLRGWFAATGRVPWSWRSEDAHVPFTGACLLGITAYSRRVLLPRARAVIGAMGVPSPS